MILFENPGIKIYIPEGVTEGHLRIMPLPERRFLNELSDDEINYLMVSANLCATMLFEIIKAEGTNIVLNENPLRVDIVARKLKDDLNLLWTPKKLSSVEMEDAFNKIKESFYERVHPSDINSEQKSSLSENDKSPEKEIIKEHENAENYLIKQLKRIP